MTFGSPKTSSDHHTPCFLSNAPGSVQRRGNEMLIMKVLQLQNNNDIVGPSYVGTIPGPRGGGGDARVASHFSFFSFSTAQSLINRAETNIFAGAR